MRRAARFSLCVLGGCAALLAGCQSLPADEAGADALVAVRPQAAAFSLSGRLSASDGVRKAAGRFSWEHAPAREAFTVLSPLGQVMAQVSADANQAVYRDAEGETLYASDLQSLLPNLLGEVPVTVAALVCWVQAVVCDGAQVAARDALGRPLRITHEDGWQVEYGAYRAEAGDAPVYRLTATRADARVQILVDQWQTH